MPLPASGPLSLQDIQAEFGGSAPTSLSEYYRNGGLVPGSLTSIPTSGSISIGMFYNLAAAFVWNYTIPSNTVDFDVSFEALFNGWSGTVPLQATITIPAGIYVVGSNSSFAAFTTGNLPVGSSVTIINNGTIVGRGGFGGNGGTVTPSTITNGTNGTNGRPALYILATTTIVNNGIIGGGGGGGGGGGAVRDSYTDKSNFTYHYQACGANGGGGASFGNVGTNGFSSGGFIGGGDATPTSTSTNGSLTAGGTGTASQTPNGLIFTGAGGSGAGMGASGNPGGLASSITTQSILGSGGIIVQSSPGAGGSPGAWCVGYSNVISYSGSGNLFGPVLS